MPRRNTGPRLAYRDAISAFVIRWYDKGRKRERSTGTSDYRAAEIALAEFIANRPVDEPNGPRRAEQFSIAEALTHYMQARERVSDPERIAYAAARLLDFWGDHSIADIRGATCRAYAEQRESLGRAQSTIRRELGALQAAVNYAHKEGLLLDPRNVVLPDKGPPRGRWLTRSEAARLLMAARAQPHLATFVRIGLETGARHRAILGLQFVASQSGGRVDLEARRINFSPLGRRQTKKRRPIVPISLRLARHLAHVRQVNKQHVVAFNGEPIASIRKAFETACDAAELEDVVPHTLRHTAITWACQRGRDPWKITQYFGVSMEVLQQTYLHHHPDFLADMVQHGSGT